MKKTYKKFIEWVKKVFNFLKTIFLKTNEETVEETDEEPQQPSEPQQNTIQPPASVQSENFVPPERTNANKYAGNGAFNSFKSLGRAKETSSKKVVVEGWFKAKTWSGGNSAQQAGFCFAGKGIVGSKWAFNLSIRPNCIVWVAPKGMEEITASCKVNLNTWYHVKAIATSNNVKMWLNGKSLKNNAKTFSGPLIGNNSEEIRLGGYKCPWVSATYYNQSLNGEISDYKIELS